MLLLQIARNFSHASGLGISAQDSVNPETVKSAAASSPAIGQIASSPDTSAAALERPAVVASLSSTAAAGLPSYATNKTVSRLL
jgi:hypothetical protein